MPAPGVSPAVPVLHRSASRARLCADPEERNLRQGYSLESLRDLELTPLNTAAARDGLFFDATLRRLFSLIGQGCGAAAQQSVLAGSVKEAFALAPLDSKLFDPEATPLLNQVRFPNHVWQRVIRLMSLSSGKGKGIKAAGSAINCCRSTSSAPSMKRCSPIADSLPRKTSTKSSPNPRKAAASSSDEDDEEGEHEGEPQGGGSTDLMDSAWFVPASRIDQYKPGERVHDLDEHGHRKLRVYPRDTFIYRLAGRDRQKSASYYTPQVLTRCLVKYALKELLKDKTADDILTLTVVEPAMGSAAFLNEAVNQLAEAYLERKQIELKRRIPHEQYTVELQKTRMYLADRNVYGVDLNPIATELAEVSLWLNAIYGEPAEPGQPPRAARVPWFGYQLFSGNSLIGARREVFAASLLKKGSKPAWYDTPPRRCAFLRLSRQRERGWGRGRSSPPRRGLSLPAARPRHGQLHRQGGEAALPGGLRTPQDLANGDEQAARSARNPAPAAAFRSHRPVVVRARPSSSAKIARAPKTPWRSGRTIRPLSLRERAGERAGERASAPSPRARKRKPSAPKACSIATTTTPRRTAASSW
jgi:hypothetical protein